MDSLFSNYRSCFARALRIAFLARSIRGESFELSFWKFFSVQCFKQINSYDCGLLALKFVFCLLSLKCELFDCYDSAKERKALRKLVGEETKFVRPSGDFSKSKATVAERDCQFKGVSFSVEPISQDKFLKLLK